MQDEPPIEPPPVLVDPAAGAMPGGEETLSGSDPASVEPMARYPGTAAYNSGWVNILPDTPVTRTFSIPGGAVDNYLVYLEFKDTGAGLGVHQRYYGGASQAVTNARVGAYWRVFTDTAIQVYRRADEAYVDPARVRIWNQPRPTYDSGWVNGNLGTYVYLTHNVGGDPDDYIVDLQFKDSGGYGVNQKCYGAVISDSARVVTATPGMELTGAS